MKAQEAMSKYGITRQTLSVWVRSGKIRVAVKPSGRYDYIDPEVDERSSVRGKVVIYARVSSSSQRENLPRQVERLRAFAEARGLSPDIVIQEVASALNYDRKGFNDLLTMIYAREVGVVLLEYSDRALRIGFRMFENLCAHFGVELVVVDKLTEKTDIQEITDDLVAIVDHFSTRIYSRRRRAKIVSAITEVEEQ